MLAPKRSYINLKVVEFLLLSLVSISYCFLLVTQINQGPYDRLPGWDAYWNGPITAGRLALLKAALLNFELPSISLFHNLGENFLGNTIHISPYYPLNYLSIFMDYENAILGRLVLSMAIGVIAAFYYFKNLTNDLVVSVFGASMYLAVPAVLMIPYFTLNIQFYLFPMVLLSIHQVINRSDFSAYFFFGLSCFFVVAGGADVHGLVMLPTVVGIYSLLAQNTKSQFLSWDSFRLPVFLVLKSIVVCMFFIVPLYDNLASIGALRKSVVPAEYLTETALGLKEFLRFVLDQGGFASFFAPTQGSGMLFYVPLVLLISSVVSVCCPKLLALKELKPAIFGLVFSSITLFIVSIGFYLLPSSIVSMGKGVLRYHLNLFPFLMVSAGILSLYGLAKGVSKKWVYGIAVVSGLVEYILWFSAPFSSFFSGIFHENSTGRYLGTNLIPVRMLNDMWLALIMCNFAIAMIIAHLRIKTTKWQNVALGISIALFSIFYLSIHNELVGTQQGNWQFTHRETFLHDQYLKLDRCLSEDFQRNRSNDLTMLTSKEGRHWLLIGLSEMHPIKGRNTIFSFRETMNPLATSIYTGFVGDFTASHTHPPPADQVVRRLDLARLIGVNWIVSVMYELDASELELVRKCEIDSNPWWPFGDNAYAYLYRLKDSLPKLYLGTAVNTETSFNSVARIRGGSLAEMVSRKVFVQESEINDEAVGVHPRDVIEITSQTTQSIFAKTNIEQSAIAVLTYAFDKNWRAYVDGKEREVVQANGVFVGVVLNHGDRNVEFRYDSGVARFGLYLSLASLFLIPMRLLPKRKYFIN